MFILDDYAHAAQHLQNKLNLLDYQRYKRRELSPREHARQSSAIIHAMDALTERLYDDLDFYAEDIW